MKTYTKGERYEINRVLEKVYEVLETTDNDVMIEVGFLGVKLYSYNGPMEGANSTFVINDGTFPDNPFTEFDADRMIAELNVLENFNKKETGTTENQ